MTFRFVWSQSPIVLVLWLLILLQNLT